MLPKTKAADFKDSKLSVRNIVGGLTKSEPKLFVGLQQQIGLKLSSEKGP